MQPGNSVQHNSEGSVGVVIETSARTVWILYPIKNSETDQFSGMVKKIHLHQINTGTNSHSQEDTYSAAQALLPVAVQAVSPPTSGSAGAVPWTAQANQSKSVKTA